MSLEDLRGAIREGRFSPDDEFSQDGMNYGPISQFKDIAYLASLKVGGQAGVAAPRSSYARPKQSVEVGRLITPILVIALIGGLGFVGYTQRETLMKLYSGFMSEAPKAKPTTTNPLKRYIATWTAAHPDVSGTVQEHLVSARLRHLEDTWKAYQTAEQAYQRALILDVDDATAIGGYVENLALWRYDLATVKEVQVARAAVKYAMELAPNNPAVFRAQAALALAAGDLNGCREGADAALKKDATDGRAKLLLSGCYMEGNVQLAIQEAERARQLQPELRRVDRVLGEAYAKTGRFASALKTLDERLKVDPDNGSVHKLYGDIARGVAMFDRAESHYRKAIAAKNDVQDAHLALADLKLELSQTSEAIREYKKAAELFPEQLGVRAVRAYAGWAQSELLRRRSERAKTLSERAMKVAGDEPRALIYIGQAAIVRGQAAVALGEPQVAITYANRAKEAVSEPSGLVLLGRAKVAMRQMDAGIKTLEEAVSADSKDPRLKGILAATYLARGGQPQAYALMRRAADVDPQQAWSRRRRGPMSLSEIPVREAIQRFRSSAGEERNASVASSAMGMLYYFLGDAGRAKAAIERALRIDNSNVTALIYDAQLALDRKDPKRAQRSALRLLAVERGSALGHLLHARALKIYVESEQAGSRWDFRRFGSDLGLEHLFKVRRRIRADQKNAFAFAREANAGCARCRRLANPTLAGEEHRRGGLIQESHQIVSLGTAAAGGCRLFFLTAGVGRDPKLLGQRVAGRVSTLGEHVAVDEHQRQALHPVRLKQPLDGRVRGEFTGVVAEIKTVDTDAVLLRPIESGGELRRLVIRVWTANTGRTAHRGIEDFYVGHD